MNNRSSGSFRRKWPFMKRKKTKWNENNLQSETKLTERIRDILSKRIKNVFTLLWEKPRTSILANFSTNRINLAWDLFVWRKEGRKEGETWIASLRYLVIFSVFKPRCSSCYALITPTNRGQARNPIRIVDDKATFFFRGKVKFTWSVRWSVSFYIYLTVGIGKFAVPKRTCGAKMEKGKLSLWKIFGTDFLLFA